MRAARTQRGIAMVTAVMIVAIAAVIAAQIAFAQQIWMRQIENTFDRGATDWLRRGALHWASTAIVDDTIKGNTVDHLGEPWAMGLPTLPVEGGTIRVSVEDAQGRFNLNNLVRNNVGYPADIAVLQRLLQELKLDPSIVHALVDWIDPDSQTSPGGAEDIDYLNGDPPYRSADRPLASVEELRLVRGFDAKTVATLAPYVTVLPTFTATVNVNTASPVLLAALVPGLALADAERLAEERLTKPFGDAAEFTGRLPKGIVLPSGCCGVRTDYFLVTLDTAIGRHERRSEALLQRGASGRGAELVWHRPHALLALDETDQSRQ
jgi:general secretion pathway protein K